MSKILSISAVAHDSGVAYVVDGEIICAFEEERFKRLKGIFNQFAFPELSLKALEEQFGVTPFDDDVIVVMPKPVVCGLDYLERILEKKSIYLFDHHLSHAATAYFLSGFEEETIILTYDAGDYNSIEGGVLDINVLQNIRDQKLPFRKTEIPEGEFVKVMSKIKNNDGTMPYQLWANPEESHWYSYDLKSRSVSSSLFLGSNNKINKLSDFAGFNSLAAFWDNYCGMNGLFGGKDEGKIVGLAAQGKYRSEIYESVKDFFVFDGDPVWKHYDSARNYFNPLDLINDLELRKDSAFMVQMLSEQYMLSFVEWIKSQHPSAKKIAFAGGIFSNVKINQKINEHSPFDEIFIAPGMGDGGLALGAALLKSNELGELDVQKIDNVFWGLETDHSFVPENQVSQNISDVSVADLLANRKVVGIFSNKREWGPRALGGTSIIYDPSDPEAQSFINSRLNRNEEMPFAPIVLNGFESDLFYCYKSKYASEFMTICYDVKEQWIEKIPGVINVYDNTSRIQIVKDNNEPFYSILKEFYELTGIPALMNTSFNVHGEPIINDVQTAFKHLKNGVIDYLIVGDKIYNKIQIEEIFKI